jgi:hypothetical protein
MRIRKINFLFKVFVCFFCFPTLKQELFSEVSCRKILYFYIFVTSIVVNKFSLFKFALVLIFFPHGNN